MCSMRVKWVVASVLTVASFACDHFQPVAPTLDVRASSAPGVTVNAPSRLTAIAVSVSRIDVSWQDNSTNESGFEVHRSTTGASGAFTLRASLAANTSAYSDTGLTASTQYCYRVRAYQTKGPKTYFSVFSASACATTQPPPPPPTPSTPSNVSAALMPGITVRVQWADNSTNELGFRVERSGDQVTWATVATIGPSSDTSVSFTDDTWTIEQQACYRVFAFNAAGDSPSASACTAPLLGPTSLTLIDGGPAWIDNSSIEDGYEVWVRFVPYCSVQPVALFAVLPADATSATAYWYGDCQIDGYLVAATKDGAYSAWAEVAVP
jgi:hypothetical protein